MFEIVSRQCQRDDFREISVKFNFLNLKYAILFHNDFWTVWGASMQILAEVIFLNWSELYMGFSGSNLPFSCLLQCHHPIQCWLRWGWNEPPPASVPRDEGRDPGAGHGAAYDRHTSVQQARHGYRAGHPHSCPQIHQKRCLLRESTEIIPRSPAAAFSGLNWS